MNNQEALEFIRKYFDEIFNHRNPDALDSYLDDNYHDDDIGEGDITDHINNSKAYLAEWFRTQPTIGVDVKDAMAQDNVVTAFIDWFVVEDGAKRAIMKGVAIFVLNNRKILKRHTYIYYKE